MIIKQDKNANRVKRHARVRKSVSGTAARPRLCAYRSLSAIYAQLVDDQLGHTLVSASSKEIDSAGKTKVEIAFLLGEKIGEKAIDKKIKAVVFDRGGYLYTGRIKAVADGARKAGLEF